ncbi:MAG: hypothetical protein ACLPTJ_05510 [Solirubrobacteraceae bacterium]
MTCGRCIALALTALGCAAVIAACGGSSSKSTTSAGYTQAVKFASCMRSHGVPSFPDPVAGGGFQFPVRSGFNPFAPAAAAAQHDCRSLLPAGGKGPGEASAQDKARTLALAQCMREHGVMGFPDPISSPPSNPTGYSILFGQPGAVIAVPSTINPQTPTFRHAATACGFPGSGSRR